MSPDFVGQRDDCIPRKWFIKAARFGTCPSLFLVKTGFVLLAEDRSSCDRIGGAFAVTVNRIRAGMGSDRRQHAGLGGKREHGSDDLRC